MADEAEQRAWQQVLNKEEEILRTAIENRCRATESFPHKLKLAFKAVDFDENGHGVETGTVSYTEFCKALERFGLYASVNVRGLFDRYNPEGADDISYIKFIECLYSEDEKPWPPPPKRTPDECKTEAKEMLREAPANNWANSSGELHAHETPTRVLSLANENHRTAKPLSWQGSPEATHMTWSRT